MLSEIVRLACKKTDLAMSVPTSCCCSPYTVTGFNLSPDQLKRAYQNTHKDIGE